MRGLLSPSAAAIASGFAGSLVWKAKNNNISLFHCCLLGSRILALIGRQAEEFDAGISFQARANAKPGCSGFAIDEDFRCHGTALGASNWMHTDFKRKRRPVAALILEKSFVKAQRFENWKLRRAFFLPYFLRSTTRGSRVKKPFFLEDGTQIWLVSEKRLGKPVTHGACLT